MVSERTGPDAPLSNTRARLVLVACVLASSVVGMDSMMTTVALPAIADGLDAGLSVQQWIVAAFLLAVGSLLLVGGALGDIHGRWVVFGIGVAGFGVAALVCAVAPNAAVLIAGRMLQGAAAALVLPSVLAIITSTFTGEQRSKAIASWSAWSGVAVIAGPIVGGFLIDLMSWRAIYGVQLPCAVLVLLLVVRTAEKRPHERVGARVDLGGALLAVPAVGGPAFFLIQGPRFGWLNPLTSAFLVAGLVALVCFVLWERRAAHPLLPLVLFHPRILAGRRGRGGNRSPDGTFRAVRPIRCTRRPAGWTAVHRWWGDSHGTGHAPAFARGRERRPGHRCPAVGDSARRRPGDAGGASDIRRHVGRVGGSGRGY